MNTTPITENLMQARKCVIVAMMAAAAGDLHGALQHGADAASLTHDGSGATVDMPAITAHHPAMFTTQLIDTLRTALTTLERGGVPNLTPIFNIAVREGVIKA